MIWLLLVILATDAQVGRIAVEVLVTQAGTDVAARLGREAVEVLVAAPATPGPSTKRRPLVRRG